MNTLVRYAMQPTRTSAHVKDNAVVDLDMIGGREIPEGGLGIETASVRSMPTDVRAQKESPRALFFVSSLRLSVVDMKVRAPLFALNGVTEL